MLGEKECRIGYSVGMLKSTTKVGQVVKIVEYVGRSNYLNSMHSEVVENNSKIKQNDIYELFEISPALILGLEREESFPLCLHSLVMRIKE